MADVLALKWGTLKWWDIKSPAATEALERYFATGEQSLGAAQQRDTDEQKQAICDLIDALDADTVHLDWDGVDVSKADAKAYVMNYGKGAASA